MASDFLFLDSGDMDVPTTGKFLNHLENVAREALNLNIMPIQEVGRGLNSILECIILDSIEDKEAAILTFEQGIALLQEIANAEKNQGKYQGDIRGYLERIASVTGLHILI
jgi:two-component system chemotaxis sensor kinase CheA